MKRFFATLAAAALAAFLTACDAQHSHDHHHGHDHAAVEGHEAAWKGVKQLVAVVHPTTGNRCSGVIRFTEVDGEVFVYAEFTGLTPNQKHGMHIHEFGDGSKADATSAGGHFNPAGHPHGLMEKPDRHAGDLGNLEADADGKTIYRASFTNISMVGLNHPIIGRSVIVHAQPYDGSQPTGNAGARIGCGIIGIANPVP
jgi:Cu-Zn family superoxide dismutase